MGVVGETPQGASPTEAPFPGPPRTLHSELLWMDGFVTSSEMPHWELPEIFEGNNARSRAHCHCNSLLK